MRFIFIIQGEGKGHRMQAEALKEMLDNHGHETIKIFQGGNLHTRWYRDQNTFAGKVSYFLSPFFIPAGNRKGINLWITIFINIFLIPVYLFEIIRIGFTIRKIKPEIVINFYDIIGGFAMLLSGPDIRKFVISHHFFFEHPDFKWPEDRKFERMLLLIHSFLTSFSAVKKLALSFTSSENIPGKRLYVVPPILRKKILQAEPLNHGHIHIYTLYAGYFSEIENWCVYHPEVKIRMFTDIHEKVLSDLPNLEVYSFSPEKFIDSLVKCCCVTCTAGFETLAEAAFLGKPIGVVPSGNHFEQYCNALDLERSGLGWIKKSILPLSEFSERSPLNNLVFKEWTLKAEKLILQHFDPPTADR